LPSSNTTVQPDTVDVRGPRFAAWVTTAVLVLTLVVSATSPLAAAAVLGVQAAIFAIGAIGGPRRHPYGQVFARVVAPRLGPAEEREPVAPLSSPNSSVWSSRSSASPHSPPALSWSASSPPRPRWWRRS
jgi:hypothetical protein